MRDHLVVQGLLPLLPGGEKIAGTVQWKFLGREICRHAVSVLMGVGWHPRLHSMWVAAVSGQMSAPMDLRYLQGVSRSTPKWAEVSSYLQGLYESEAESLPSDRGRECICDAEDEHESEVNGVSVAPICSSSSTAAAIVPETVDCEPRYLPSATQIKAKTFSISKQA